MKKGMKKTISVSAKVSRSKGPPRLLKLSVSFVVRQARNHLHKDVLGELLMTKSSNREKINTAHTKDICREVEDPVDSKVRVRVPDGSTLFVVIQ